jgi:hypothetical protein
MPLTLGANMPDSVLLVGHSHLSVFDLHRRLDPPDSPPFLLKTISDSPRLVEGLSCLRPAESQADGLKEFCGGRTVVLLWRGGYHHAKFAVVASPQFDFLLSDDPDSEIDPATAIVAEAMVEAVLKPAADDLLGCLSYLKALEPLPPKRIIVAAIPPPKGDMDFIRARIGAEFGADLAQKLHDAFPEIDIISPMTMLKIWKLLMRMNKRTALEAGVEFLDIPPGSQDEHGFLLPEYYSHDVTHANAAWGNLFLSHLNNYLDGASAQ